MVCKIVFCSEFPDIPDNAEEREGEEGEEEHRQLQSVMRFTQTQLTEYTVNILYKLMCFLEINSL